MEISKIFKCEEEYVMEPVILCYEKCTTCKKALKWVAEKGTEVQVRPIREENPSAAELRQWHEKSGLPLKRFFNTSGNLYKELKLKDKLPAMSEEEQYQLLSTDGMLVKRPLLVTENGVCPGFDQEQWEQLLGAE